MGKLIAVDLDGTLFYPKHRIKMISDKCLAFIRRRIDLGDRFVIVSGRNGDFGQKVIKKIKRSIGIIGCNGSIIMDNEKVIKLEAFDPKILKEAIQWIRENTPYMGLFVMTSDYQFILEKYFKNPFYNLGYFFWTASQGVLRTPMKISKKKFDEAIEEGKVTKLMVMYGLGKKNIENAKNSNKEVFRKFGDVLETSWSVQTIELTPKGCFKSNGLKFYSDYHKINHDDVFVCGDSGNDISMFKEFPEHSFCMSHAPLSVSKYAKYTMNRVEDIEVYLEERK